MDQMMRNIKELQDRNMHKEVQEAVGLPPRRKVTQQTVKRGPMARPRFRRMHSDVQS